MQEIRGSDRADFLTHLGDQFPAKRLARRFARIQGYIDVNALTFQIMRHTDHGRLRHFGMGDQGAFHFRRSHTVAGDVDHVIDAPGDPVIPVRIAARPVTGGIHTVKSGKIGLYEPLMIAVNGPHLPRPGLLDNQIAFRNAL